MTEDEMNGVIEQVKAAWRGVPKIGPTRVRGVIAEVCDCCDQPTDSDAHIYHCRKE